MEEQKIKAKSVLKDKFWILQKDNIKVGHAELIGEMVYINVNGLAAGKYASVDDMKKSGLFEFTELPKPAAKVSEDVHGFPTDELAYNAVWNVRYKLPLYTQTADSMSWFAAGYYKVSVNGNWVVQFCPKLIALQRNEYKGPFKTDPGLNQFDGLFE